MINEETQLDSALQLKKYVRDIGCPESADIQHCLENSAVIAKILAEKIRTDTFTGLRKLEFLLAELSEIPFFERLETVQVMLNTLYKQINVDEGFSLTGKQNGVLACHNALCTSIFIRAGKKEWAEQGVRWIISYFPFDEGFSLTGKQNGVLACHNALCTSIFIRAGKKEWAEQGVRWIISYFPFDRNEPSNWQGKDLFHRFGGCVGNSPCYDGVVKSVKALSEYAEKYGELPGLRAKLQQGLDYILKHRVIFHQNNDEYLYDDLITLFYPYPYRTNIIEALSVLKTEKLLDRPECQAALDYLKDEYLYDDLITLFYPYPYRTNIIEALSVLKTEKLLDRPECQAALDYLKAKQRSDGFWQAEKIFMKSSWVPFDDLKKTGMWITDEINWIFSAVSSR